VINKNEAGIYSKLDTFPDVKQTVLKLQKHSFQYITHTVPKTTSNVLRHFSQDNMG